MPAYYSSDVGSFIVADADQIFATLVQRNAAAGYFQILSSAIEVWKTDVAFLQQSLREVVHRVEAASSWGILLEFPIPRQQQRVDLILLVGGVVVVVELKSGKVGSAAAAQVEDYALDLHNFHAASEKSQIIPVAVGDSVSETSCGRTSESLVALPRVIARSELSTVLVEIGRTTATAIQIETGEWDQAPYHPVPSIIEAARTIFAGMEVREIAHAQCDPYNLTRTVDALVEIVESAIRNEEKVIAFVTGVPGSGKTLAGLRAVHDERLRSRMGTDPAFFSGNSPLVKVLREALVQDAVRRGGKRKHVQPKIYTMIQNIHVLARESYDDPQQRAPYERVMVFDEAQRAWDAERNSKKFRRNISEPEMILSIMGRHDGWAVIVCLVGGGQEIHDGEAGLTEWGRTLRKTTGWKVYAAREAIVGGAAVAGHKLFDGEDSGVDVHTNDALHLPVSTRSIRAESINGWSNAVVESQLELASSAIAALRNFPVRLTRDLDAGREWLLSHARGSERCGLVASSGAARLRAEGIETSTSFHRDYPYEHWFLKPRGDVRSSCQLEVVATEFEIQGLELDWVGLCWGGDLIWDSKTSRWLPRAFSGTKWKLINREAERQFLLNSYRVLLTRARRGLLIYCPYGDAKDPTREIADADNTYAALVSAGVKPIAASNAAAV